MKSSLTFCIFIIVFCTALAVAAQQATPYELVMTSLRTGETEIFRTNLATGDAKNISRSAKSEDRYPAVSADGKKVLFTSNRWDNDTAFNVFLSDIDGNNVRQLTFEKSEVAYYPGWSADGRTILYNLGNTSAVVVMDNDGKNGRTIQNARDAYLSPDGKTIAFTRQCGNGYCLFITDRDGKNTKQLTDNPNELGAVGPVISPDGKRIAYVDKPTENNDVLEIFSCNLDGADKKQLTHLGKISTSPCWSPDGEWISFRVTNDAFWRNDATREAAYAQKAGDKRPVWIMQKNGSGVTIVEPLRFQCGIDGSRASFIK